jgi:hypothetical protein
MIRWWANGTLFIAHGVRFGTYSYGNDLSATLACDRHARMRIGYLPHIAQRRPNTHNRNPSRHLTGDARFACFAPRCVAVSWNYSPAADLFYYLKGSSANTAFGVLSSVNYTFKGVENATAMPYSHAGAVAVADANGLLWMIGGLASVPQAASSNTADSNDVWSYNISSNNWRWVAGDKPVYNQFNNGAFGTFRVPSIYNYPPYMRYMAGVVEKATGMVYMYGGGRGPSTVSYSSAVWAFNLTSWEWTWMAGA